MFVSRLTQLIREAQESAAQASQSIEPSFAMQAPASETVRSLLSRFVQS